MKIGSNIRTEPVQSAYPVSGVEPCGAAANDADVERLCRGGGEAPLQALGKRRPQTHHRAGEEPQTAGHVGSAGSAGDHTTGSRIWTQAGHGAGDLGSASGRRRGSPPPISAVPAAARCGTGAGTGCGLWPCGRSGLKNFIPAASKRGLRPNLSLSLSLRGLDRANFP